MAATRGEEAGDRFLVRQGTAFHVLTLVVGLGLAVVIFLADPRRSLLAVVQARAALGWWEAPALVAVFAAALVLHELAHGFAGRWVGGGPVRYGTRFVLRVVPLAFWCGLGGRMSRGGLMAVLMAPQVVVPVALGAMALAAPAAWGLCWLVYVLMVIGSAADAVLLVAVLGSRARWVRDTAMGIVEART